MVNVRKELCGAFVNTINVTLVNYTASGQETETSFRTGKKSESQQERSTIYLFNCINYLVGNRLQFSKFDVPKNDYLRVSGPQKIR